MSCKAAVNRQGHAEHEAGTRTAEPENRRGDLVGTAQSGDRLIAHDLVDGVRPHSPSHGCIDHAGAHGINPNATRGIVHGGALCQPDYSMLGRVIGSPARLADEAAKRGTVDNGAAALGTHLEQLVFHAGPDTAQIDGDHVVEGTRGFIGQIAHRTQDTGVVERHVQLTEGGNRALDHGRDSKKNRLTETVITRPFREFYLADQCRFDPAAPFHFGSSQSLVPATPASRRKVVKGTFINPNFVQLRKKSVQKFFAKASSDSASKFKFLPFAEADK